MTHSASSAWCTNHAHPMGGPAVGSAATTWWSSRSSLPAMFISVLAASQICGVDR